MSVTKPTFTLQHTAPLSSYSHPEIMRERCSFLYQCLFILEWKIDHPDES